MDSSKTKTRSSKKAIRKKNYFSEEEVKPKTKAGKAKKVATVMGEYKRGSLKSGKNGKPVRKRSQAVAIAMSEAGMKKKRKK